MIQAFMMGVAHRNKESDKVKTDYENKNPCKKNGTNYGYGTSCLDGLLEP